MSWVVDSFISGKRVEGSRTSFGPSRSGWMVEPRKIKR
jgi:hypothetical protein